MATQYYHAMQGYSIWLFRAKVMKDVIWAYNQGNLTTEEFESLKKMVDSSLEDDVHLAESLLDGILSLKEEQENNSSKTYTSPCPTDF